MIADTRGALRSGLYASRSIATPSTAAPTIESSNVGTNGRPSAVPARKHRNAPTMNTSPWAKLIIERVP